MRLNVDLSWYTRYRSSQNPDFGVKLKGPFTIDNEPAIPLNDTDTPPDQAQPVLPAPPQEARMQAIANTAGFHFAFIEQGGASLYPTLAFKATDPEVLRILVSIGGVEIDHFGLWHDKAGNAVAQPLAGVTDPATGLTFPDLNALNSELDQTNLILPEPCTFISKNLPECSVIRPTSTKNGGAVATIKAFTDDLFFLGQPTGVLRPGEPASDRSRFGPRIMILTLLFARGCICDGSALRALWFTFSSNQGVSMFEGLFQPMHLLVIFGLALLVFGPKKLPELGKGMGEGIRGFKSAMKAKKKSRRTLASSGTALKGLKGVNWVLERKSSSCRRSEFWYSVQNGCMP